MTGRRSEREEARERLRASVDALAERANLQVQMQKEPLKMLGGASAVGALVGVVVGRQFKRSKKVYVDVDSPVKHQRALIKAQQQHKGNNVGGALVATLSTLAFKVLNDRVIKPRLEEMAGNLLERAGQTPDGKPGPTGSRTTGRAADTPRLPSLSKSPAPAASTGAAASFLKRNQGAEVAEPERTGVPGGQAAPGTGSSVPTPTSTVVAKAQGSPIDPQEKANPNIR